MIFFQLGIVLILGFCSFYIAEKWNRANLLSKVFCIAAMISAYMLSIDGYFRTKESMRKEIKIELR